MVAQMMLVGDKIRKNLGKHRKIFDDEQRSPNRKGFPRAWVSAVQEMIAEAAQPESCSCIRGGEVILGGGSDLIGR